MNPREAPTASRAIDVYKRQEESIPYSIEEEGRGPIHVLEGQGADGLKRTKTGSVSGLTTEEVVQEPSNVVRRNVSPQVGEDKVVALSLIHL